MRSVMKHQFSEVPRAEISRSTFDRSHGHKTTFDADRLIPFYVDEALPGDTFNLNATILARLNTPIFPIMDNMFLDTQYFFVPNRLVWDNWEKFNGQQDKPGDSTDYLVPTITSTLGFGPHEMNDYFGVPTGIPGLEVNCLHHRAYNLIFNEWYRDQNILDPVVVNTDDGPDDPLDYAIRNRGKRHDYFTSALPWPQKGEAVELPISGPVDVKTGAGQSESIGIYSADPGVSTYRLLDASFAEVNIDISTADAMTNKMFVDLGDQVSVTINEMRQAFQVQKLLERDARGGTRYTEVVKAHFGVTSPDARLQRPEYLGGSTQLVNISSVPQTSSTDATTPQGNLAAYGTVNSRSGFTKSFTEHGVILGILSVRADLTYQQGLNRMFSRQTRLDYFWPALQHLGEQEVLGKEIFAEGSNNPEGDASVFGYQERFAEYRYKPSIITGQMRSSHPTTLDAWHLSQSFVNRPTLDKGFIESITPIDRVVAVPSEPDFTCDIYIGLKCTRPMPIYGVPGLIDHF